MPVIFDAPVEEQKDYYEFRRALKARHEKFWREIRDGLRFVANKILERQAKFPDRYKVSQCVVGSVIGKAYAASDLREMVNFGGNLYVDLGTKMIYYSSGSVRVRDQDAPAVDTIENELYELEYLFAAVDSISDIFSVSE